MLPLAKSGVQKAVLSLAKPEQAPSVVTGSTHVLFSLCDIGNGHVVDQVSFEFMGITCLCFPGAGIFHPSI